MGCRSISVLRILFFINYGEIKEKNTYEARKPTLSLTFLIRLRFRGYHWESAIPSLNDGSL